jgi:hypothetical protein
MSSLTNPLPRTHSSLTLSLHFECIGRSIGCVRIRLHGRTVKSLIVLVLRSYTHRQFQKMIDKTEDWVIEEVYDFRYSIDDPIEIDDWTEDVVYILKRK